MFPPARYSRNWWIVVAITVVFEVGIAILILFSLRDADTVRWLVAWVLFSFLFDIGLAVWMEAVAPTRVVLGPGDRGLDDDASQEVAVVSADFDAGGHGYVLVRGESWRARNRMPGGPILKKGAEVCVVDRDGLLLVVEAAQSSS